MKGNVHEPGMYHLSDFRENAFEVLKPCWICSYIPGSCKLTMALSLLPGLSCSDIL